MLVLVLQPAEPGARPGPASNTQHRIMSLGGTSRCVQVPVRRYETQVLNRASNWMWSIAVAAYANDLTLCGLHVRA